MVKHAMFAVLLALVLGPPASLARPSGSLTPPAFTADAPVKTTLRAYPLGIITMQAALSDYGAPHRKLKLADGEEWWAYDVGAGRSYTLVFDRRGVVANVVYNENGPRNGLTALALLPPAFAPDASIAWILRHYPLGVVPRQVALERHGSPDRKIELANGHEGWVYDVGGFPWQSNYAPRTYTLVFDRQGVVVDVIYNAHDPRNGLTARSLQGNTRGAG